MSPAELRGSFVFVREENTSFPLVVSDRISPLRTAKVERQRTVGTRESGTLCGGISCYQGGKSTPNQGVSINDHRGKVFSGV